MKKFLTARLWTHKINRLALAMYARSPYNTTNFP